MFDAIGEVVEPEATDLRENGTFAWQTVGHDDIEGGDTVGSDDEESVGGSWGGCRAAISGRQAVNVADFAVGGGEILDFGSQYTQLITRRIRESNVYSITHPHFYPLEKIELKSLKGIILSGGPMSVYDNDVPSIDKRIFELGVPILGVCYGMQLITKMLNGKVEPADNREYGKAELLILTDSMLLKNVRNMSTVWMSHGDLISSSPNNFKVIAKTPETPVAAIENTDSNRSEEHTSELQSH